MHRLLLPFCFVWLGLVHAAEKGHYLTWVDEQGRLRNTFVGQAYLDQQRRVQQLVRQLDQERMQDLPSAAVRWPGAATVRESKRRYYTWIDADGNIQNSFYAGSTVENGGMDDAILRGGERSSDYIDAEAFEAQGFVRSEHGEPYYTWIDEKGRMRNAQVPIERQERSPAIPTAAAITFNEGRQIEFARRQPLLPDLDGSEQSEALKALLKGTQTRSDTAYQEWQKICCEQLSEQAFTELSAEQPRYDELNRFSPSFSFPLGKSYYAAFKLPRSQGVYGLRIRSFANREVLYPSLLFLDESKRPTRLVSDAVYKFNPETWYRYAFIEGTVPVRANQGERYVLLLTTEEDRTLQTLDNKPFKRPMQALAVDGSGMQTHRHSEQGGFEVAIVR